MKPRMRSPDVFVGPIRFTSLLLVLAALGCGGSSGTSDGGGGSGGSGGAGGKGGAGGVGGTGGGGGGGGGGGAGGGAAGAGGAGGGGAGGGSTDGGSTDGAPDGGTSDGGSSDTAAEAGAGATVKGTLTLPGSASGKPYFVRIMTMPGSTFVGEASGTTAGGTTLPYSIASVPAGTYFILGFVDVDASGGTSSTPGDYRGWYGHTGDGNPPSAASAVVPSSGTVTFDYALVLAP